jgi:hypothetical protein
MIEGAPCAYVCLEKVIRDGKFWSLGTLDVLHKEILGRIGYRNTAGNRRSPEQEIMNPYVLTRNFVQAVMTS